MSRRSLSLATLAIAVFFCGCGSDANEEAPPAGTGAVIAQAPPSAVGANVESPSPPSRAALPTPKTTGGKLNPKSPLLDPSDPTPLPGTVTPKKGTDL